MILFPSCSETLGGQLPAHTPHVFGVGLKQTTPSVLWADDLDDEEGIGLANGTAHGLGSVSLDARELTQGTGKACKSTGGIM